MKIRPVGDEFSQQIFEESLNIKFHENPSSGRRIFSPDFRKNTQISNLFPDGRRTNGRNFAKAPTNFKTSRPALGQPPRPIQ